MKLHLPHILRAALLAALLCCTTAFGTVTVTVDGQDLTVKKGEKIRLGDPDDPYIGSNVENLTIEEGGELIVGMECAGL